jgi:hypothetical protein
MPVQRDPVRFAPHLEETSSYSRRALTKQFVTLIVQESGLGVISLTGRLTSLSLFNHFTTTLG